MLRNILILLVLTIFCPCVAFTQVTEPVAVDVLAIIKDRNDCQNTLQDWNAGEVVSGDGVITNEEGVLTRLDLSNKKLCGVLAVRNLTNLHTLQAGDNNLDGIVLAGLYGLKELDLSYNRLANIDFLDGCPVLEKLKLEGNVLFDVGMLAHMGELRQLDLSYNHIGDITPLQDLAALEELSLFHNKISNVAPLSGLYALKQLDLRTNALEDITPLRELINMETLKLGDNNLTQVSVLAGMTGIKTLDLADNHLRDARVLENMLQLEWLDLRNNMIRDISPFAERLEAFETLKLEGNALTLHQMYDPERQCLWAARQQNVYFTLRVQYLRVVDHWVIPKEDLEIDGVKSKVVVEGPKYGAHFDESSGRVIFSKPGIYTVSLSNDKVFNSENHALPPVTKTGTIAVFEALPPEKSVITGREDMVTPTMLKSLFVTLNTHGVAEALDYSDPYFDMLWILSHLAAPAVF